MLIISKDQMKAFDDAALLRFENEMMVHSHRFTPQLSKVLGKEQLRGALRQAIHRATTHGFTNRGPIRLYVELMFLFGSDFDTDPQYLRIAEALPSSADQMERAEVIYKIVLEYQEEVSGPDAENLYRGLKAISAQAREPDSFSKKNFEEQMLLKMKQVFPQKYVYVGDDGLRALIAEARDKAQAYRLPTLRNEALMVSLMFTLGHGCTTDPLYPWIPRTLTNEKIVDPAGRARRLEKRAATWLDTVLAGPWKGQKA